MKIPKIQSTISAQFPNAQILNTIQPDEVIAMGCARQASFVVAAGAKHHLDMDQVDVAIPALSADVFVKAVASTATKEVLFASGTTLPAERQLPATTFAVNGEMQAEILQGEHVDVVKATAEAIEGLQLVARIDHGVDEAAPPIIQLQFKATEQFSTDPIKKQMIPFIFL